jgi:2-polyprenyl-3-methyl-5-hydroxy-6-metoxy-1,4-benzoquinol methylase
MEHSKVTKSNQDLVREFWDKQPCNIKHSAKEVGSKEFFIEVTKKRYFVEPHIIDFLNVKSFQNCKVLELGCGIGTDAAFLASNGLLYQGIDISGNSIEIARKRFQLFDLQGKFYQTPIEDFSIINAGFFVPDLVYTFGVLHHTINPELSLLNIVNQVPSGCHFKIMLYNKNSFKMAMINSGLDQFEAQKDVPIAETYSKVEVEEMLLRVGLTNINISIDHIFMYDIKKYKSNIYELSPWFESMPDNMLNGLKKNLGWHLLIDAVKK